MQILGPAPSLSAGTPREAGRAVCAGVSFGVAAEGPVAAPALSGAAAALPLASLEVLVALQALPDATERRRRSIRRGGALLDRLDEIRMALLDGALPADTLIRLRVELAAAREATDDPSLNEVLREIELRAEVELARLEVLAGSGGV